METSGLPPLHVHSGNTWRCSRIRHDRAMFAIHDKIGFLSSSIQKPLHHVRFGGWTVHLIYEVTLCENPFSYR